MIFLVLFHFFTLLTNRLFKAHLTVKSNAPATLPRQYTHTQTLYQSHVNAAGCQRCLPFHWLTADIRIPAVSPPPCTPTPPQDRETAIDMQPYQWGRGTDSGRVVIRAVRWAGPWEVRIPHPAVGAPRMDWTERGSSSVEETRVGARAWASEWEKAVACDVLFSLTRVCAQPRDAPQHPHGSRQTLSRDNALKNARMQQKSTGILIRRWNQEPKPRGTTRLPIVFSLQWVCSSAGGRSG